MKNLLLLLILLVPISTFASGDFSKDSACKLKDGVYEKNLQVNYPGYTTQVLNFVKAGKIMYFIVNATKNDYKTPEKGLYTYDCKGKKSKLLSDLTRYTSDYLSEIDYINSSHIFIRNITSIGSKKHPRPTEEVGPASIYDRNTGWFGDWTFQNQSEIQNQYIQDFGFTGSLEYPFVVTDVTKGRDGNLLVWITWYQNNGNRMLRALSVDNKTFFASNVLYDYRFKKFDGGDAWLKMQGGSIYEKTNANQWFKLDGVDTKTFRALEIDYGRDNTTYSLSDANKYLPIDIIHKGFHIWYSPATMKIYTYNLGDWSSIVPKDPGSLNFHEYTSFDSDTSICTNTTDSYGYYGEDSIFCYGDIGGSHATFGIVGKRK